MKIINTPSLFCVKYDDNARDIGNGHHSHPNNAKLNGPEFIQNVADIINASKELYNTKVYF